MKPLAIDLFCGLGGWTEALIDLGYFVAGFDIERHVYDAHAYPGHLVIQDVTTLHGSQFKDAALIVASPPCQEYSYMAMPWKRAKEKAAAIRADKTGKELARLNHLFNECFRIQREACAAAGRHIPMVVENVRGAQPWVGRARWNYGSFYLWGDVPALMPVAAKVQKFNPDARRDGIKAPGMNWSDQSKRGQDFTRLAGRHAMGRKQPGISGPRANGKGDRWFQDGAAAHGSKSPRRKAASAMIAKIPMPLALHIGATYLPENQ